MINCNPETVSTDYDTSDRLYFEPLTLEDVLEVIHAESQSRRARRRRRAARRPDRARARQGPRGGRRADPRHDAPTRSTSPRSAACSRASSTPPGLLAPRNGTAIDVAGAVARRRGASATRCSCARATCSAAAAWRSSTTRPSLADYFERIEGQGIIGPAHPLLVDRFLDDAIEIDVDALYDGTELYIGGVMEHIEEAGIHSGDSSCTLPPVTLGRAEIDRVREATRAIAEGVGVRGLLNVQFAIGAGVLYVLEANPRASPHRAVRLEGARHPARQGRVAASWSARRIAELIERGHAARHDGSRVPLDAPVAVKEAVLPFKRFRTQRGHRRRLRARPGDALDRRGHGHRHGLPDARSPRARLAAYGGHADERAPSSSRSADRDKRAIILPGAAPAAARLRDRSRPRARPRCSRRNGIEARDGAQVLSDKPGADAARRSSTSSTRGEVDVVINTPSGRSARADGYEIRAATVAADKPLFTTIAELSAPPSRRSRRSRGGFEVTQPAGVRASTARQRRDAHGRRRRDRRFGERLAAAFAAVRAPLRRHRPARLRCSREWGLPDDADGRPRVRPARRRGGRRPRRHRQAAGRVLRAARLRGLRRARARARARRATPGSLVIADAKRGDIGSTVDGVRRGLAATRLAARGRRPDGQRLPGRRLARRGHRPGRAAPGKGLFVLAATSNPEAARDPARRPAAVDRAGSTVAQAITQGVVGWNRAERMPRRALGSIGVVLGATIDLRLAGIGIDVDAPRPACRCSRPASGTRARELARRSARCFGALRRRRHRERVAHASSRRDPTGIAAAIARRADEYGAAIA